MKLTFLGTRGNTRSRNRRHKRHSALLVSYRGRRVMIDCGADWAGRLRKIDPRAIFITHAHPDHAWGLKDGADCAVYATAEAWESMAEYPIERPHRLVPRKAVEVGGMVFEAFPVIHSLRAPAVGYRISAGRAAIFYVPDVVDVHDRGSALSGIHAYIGDGACLSRPLVRRHGDRLFGHTTMRAQLGWCEEAGVPQALFTHCGSEILNRDERRLGPKIRAMGRKRRVQARIAYDGLEMTLP